MNSTYIGLYDTGLHGAGQPTNEAEIKVMAAASGAARQRTDIDEIMPTPLYPTAQIKYPHNFSRTISQRKENRGGVGPPTQARDARDQNGLAEDGAPKGVADGAVGGEPH